MFFSWEEHHPLRRRVWLVYGLVALNTAAFLFTALSGNFRGVVLAYGFVPMQANPVSFFTSMFLHADLWHLLGNMLYLWIYGDNLEDRMGAWLFAGAYLFTGTFATFSHWMASAHSAIPLVGASGAISGLMAFYLVMFPNAAFRILVSPGAFIPALRPFRRLAIPIPHVPAGVAIGIWLFIQVLGAMAYKGDTAGVAYYGHIGGAASGLALAFALSGSGVIIPDPVAGTPQDPHVKKRKKK